METIERIRREAMEALRPPPEIPLADWVEANVFIPQTASATPGRMRLWNYQRGILDALDDPSVSEVVVMKSARIGFTALLSAYLGHLVATNPCPILVTQPTADDARAFSVDVEALFEASPALRGLITDGADDSGRSTMMRRLFGGGSLEFLSASSPRQFRRKLGRIGIADEIDAYEMTDEGSILDLLRMRTQSYRDRKLVYGGTPIFTHGIVSQLYADSDMRVFQVRCVECGDYSEIKWADLHFDSDDLEKPVHWCCPKCGCLIPETRKAEMVANGRWFSTNPDNTRRVGFRLNSLISPHHNANWNRLAQEFVAAKRSRDTAQLQAFVNLILGEGWEETGETIDESALTLAPHDLDNLPDSALYLTGGCDVQADRLEFTSVAWDAEGRGTVLSHEVAYGDPLHNDVWIALSDMIARRFRHPRGGTLAYDRVLVDAGDGVRVAAIYDFCRRRGPQVFPSKGVSGWKQPAVALGKAADKTVRLQLLGVDGLKDRVHRMASAGSLIFSETLPPDFAEQLAGEEIRTKYVRGFAVREWHRVGGRRSEALDCCAMALAARHLLHWQPDRRADELASAAAPKPVPRVIRSKWLEGR